MFLPLIVKLYLNYHKYNFIHSLEIKVWRQHTILILNYTKEKIINLATVVGSRVEFEASKDLFQIGQWGWHNLGVSGNLYLNTGIKELKLVSNIIAHIIINMH